MAGHDNKRVIVGREMWGLGGMWAGICESGPPPKGRVGRVVDAAPRMRERGAIFGATGRRGTRREEWGKGRGGEGGKGGQGG